MKAPRTTFIIYFTHVHWFVMVIKLLRDVWKLVGFPCIRSPNVFLETLVSCVRECPRISLSDMADFNYFEV